MERTDQEKFEFVRDFMQNPDTRLIFNSEGDMMAFSNHPASKVTFCDGKLHCKYGSRADVSLSYLSESSTDGWYFSDKFDMKDPALVGNLEEIFYLEREKRGNQVYKTDFVNGRKWQKNDENGSDLQTFQGIFFVTRFCYIYKVTDLQIFSTL